MTQAKGFVAPGYELVHEAFTDDLDARADSGAFAAMVDGELVVDLWGGLADPESGREWEAGTAAVIFSGTKGIMATALMLLVDRGALDLDATVASYWPEFAAGGKQAITVRQLGSHAAGLPGAAAADRSRRRQCAAGAGGRGRRAGAAGRCGPRPGITPPPTACWWGS